MSGSSAPRRIDVVAAVLLRPAAEFGAVGRQEFLLAQRPPGKAYAGYWEFPGGKVEAGESGEAALRRELHEELGIDCETIHPWLLREFDYPHAQVRLRFFRVPRWRGAIAPIEHTGFAWVACGSTPTVTPVLPANTPILAALGLPDRYAITDAETRGVEAEHGRLEQALQAGLRLVQLRDKTLPAAAREAWCRSALHLAHAYGARLLVNDDVALAQAVGADGVHLSSAALRACSARPPVALVAASCHDEGELRRAAALGLDLAVLGPVLPTASHPGAASLGWAAFAALAADAGLPVYALGGMRSGHADLAIAHGAHGIAMLRGWGRDQLAPDSSSGSLATGTR